MRKILLASFGPLLLFLLAAISVAHYTQTTAFSPFWVGILGWVSVTFWLHYLLHQKKDLLWGWAIFLIFLVLGQQYGPFLEPPADPFEHLRRAHQLCRADTRVLEVSNFGFWHYSMISDFLCQVGPGDERKLWLIDWVHSFFWGLLAVGTFILARASKLPREWCVIAVVVVFYYFGTNRFSFFSYYSLAPSFSSILIMWLWVAQFFFVSQVREGVRGIFVAIGLMPVLVVNHLQEASFLFLLVIIWWVVFIIKSIWLNSSKKHQVLLVFGSLLVGWILPQTHWFQSGLFHFLPGGTHLAENHPNLWHHNSGWILGPNFSARIGDSLALLGFVPFFCAPWFLGMHKPNISIGERQTRTKVWLISSLPILLYLIPLTNIIWAALARWDIHWRLVYISMYWIGIAHLFYGLKKPLKVIWRHSGADRGILTFQKGGNILMVIVVALMLAKLAGVRSAPVFGKRDFISLPSRLWWPAWKPLIAELQPIGRVPVQSDPTTSTIIGAVFDFPVFRFRHLQPTFSITETRCSELAISTNCLCLINLAGFSPSWVSVETGHWSPAVANTAAFYQLEDRSDSPDLPMKPLSGAIIFPFSAEFYSPAK